MKKVIQITSHFLSAVFVSFLIGLALAILLMQSKFIDMRFDVSYLITIFSLIGVLSYFTRVFMNATIFAIWEKKILSGILVVVSGAMTLAITLMNGSLSVVPAYLSRRGLFLEGSLSLNAMNSLLIGTVVVGLISIIIAHRIPLALTKETKMEWSHLTRASRIGMVTLFGAILLFMLLYLGQGAIQNAVNDSVIYLKNADVEGFRNYLLSFGPLAAIVSAALMVFQSILAPLPAFVITFANGLLFGWFFGAILSWSSAMLGAVICFFIAKYLGRPVVEKIVTKNALAWWDRFFKKYGSHSVFIARLLPIVSFDLVSYAAGTTAIPFWKFFWATGLGQLPATILYSYLGRNATGTVQILFYLFTIVIVLAVLAMLLRPYINRKLIEKKEV